MREDFSRQRQEHKQGLCGRREPDKSKKLMGGREGQQEGLAGPAVAGIVKASMDPLQGLK